MKIEAGKTYFVIDDSDWLCHGDVVEVISLREKDDIAEIEINQSERDKMFISNLERAPLEELNLVKAEPTEQPAEYPPGTKLTSNRLFTIDEPSKPAHYDTGIDTIAFLRANCPSEQVEGFLRGNALKYLQRYDKKNGVEDLRKAKHYVEMLIEELEGRA